MRGAEALIDNLAQRIGNHIGTDSQCDSTSERSGPNCTQKNNQVHPSRGHHQKVGNNWTSWTFEKVLGKSSHVEVLGSHVAREAHGEASP